MSMEPNDKTEASLIDQMKQLPVDPVELLADGENFMDRINEISSMRLERIKDDLDKASDTAHNIYTNEIAPNLTDPTLGLQFRDYLVDVFQRQVLFSDTLRKRGNNFVQHVEAGQPPLLAFDYELILDGESLDRPTNYSLVLIKPGADDPETRHDGRPYIIIDPRAGHGSGIGGFKHESEVGVALRGGHPVYFVIFKPMPVKGQTIGDVTASEAAFVREVRRRHKNSPHPIVIGNCQGGWAAMLLAATNPDITGPVVANGTPLSYWAGETGGPMMRYLGGVMGGMVPVMMMSDLAGGLFDGAHLVQNFESLNPGNTWWMKYYSAFAAGDKEAPRYLEFERWWSGFYLMNEEEIRWILENLFIGNKLARGKAFLDENTHVDLRNIRSPIIIFCSHGDNITPPQQALYWIPDNYKSVDEIKIRGQRIIYTLHKDIGHLGIFVSSTVANEQHKEIVSTLKTIEALAPGLYEMKINSVDGQGVDKEFTVEFEERQVEDILALGDGTRDGEKAFSGVSRMSLASAELYDTYMRPLVKSMVVPQIAKSQIDNHPIRSRRYWFSDKNPFLAGLPVLAETVRENRHAVEQDNLFLKMETLGASMMQSWWDTMRDIRELQTESLFYGIWGNPFLQQYGKPDSKYISDAPDVDLASLPEVQRVLDDVEHGGYAEAVIRMLVFLANSRHAVRRDRLEKANEMMETTPPFSTMTAQERVKVIHRQTITTAFEREAAFDSLPILLTSPTDRKKALAFCAEIAGPAEEMEPSTKALFAKFAALLEIENPLEPKAKKAKSRSRKPALPKSTEAAE